MKRDLNTEAESRYAHEQSQLEKNHSWEDRAQDLTLGELQEILCDLSKTQLIAIKSGVRILDSLETGSALMDVIEEWCRGN